MRHTFTGLYTLICLAVTSHAFAQSPTESGLKPQELAQIAHALPATEVDGIWLFHEAGNKRTSAAVLTSQLGKGWEVVIVSPRSTSGYAVSWNSGFLDSTFGTSSADALGTYDLRNERALTFYGCTLHICPMVYSVLLYVPSLKRAFIGTCNNGDTSYSFALTPANAEYKRAVDELFQHKTYIYGDCSVKSKERR